MAWGPVHVVGVVRSVTKITGEMLEEENEFREGKRWKKIHPYTRVKVEVEGSDGPRFVPVESTNGRRFEIGSKADLLVECKGAGSRVRFMLVEPPVGPAA